MDQPTFSYSDDGKPFVVLEIANNHMGDVKHGVDLICHLNEVIQKFQNDFDFGIKFQFRELETFIHENHKGSELKYVRRFEETILSNKEWETLIESARDIKVSLLATPFDEPSVDRCLLYNVDFIKIASCSIVDWPLVERIAETKKPVIFSTAGANLEQIDAMVSFFENRFISATLMHCVGLYPTEDYQLNIGQIAFYKNRYRNLRVGFSTHESPSLSLTGGLAYALGARVFEKHVGLDNERFQNNAYSVNPDQLGGWLAETKKSIDCIGAISEKVKNTVEEIQSIKALQRGMFASNDLQVGQKITKDHVFYAIPSEAFGFTANDFSKYAEFSVKKEIKAGEAITSKNVTISNNRSEVQEIVEKLRSFVKEARINLPYGVLMEISHHYGLENFYSTGMAMITIVNEEYCKKILFLLPGQQHPEQFHKQKKETFHVIYGTLNLELDGRPFLLKPGETQTVKAGVRHKFYSDSGCVIEEISTTHKNEDSFYVDDQIQSNVNRKTVVNFWV